MLLFLEEVDFTRVRQSQQHVSRLPKFDSGYPHQPIPKAQISEFALGRKKWCCKISPSDIGVVVHAQRRRRSHGDARLMWKPLLTFSSFHILYSQSNSLFRWQLLHQTLAVWCGCILVKSHTKFGSRHLLRFEKFQFSYLLFNGPKDKQFSSLRGRKFWAYYNKCRLILL